MIFDVRLPPEEMENISPPAGSKHSVTATAEIAAISGALRRNEFRCRSPNLQLGKFNDDPLTR